jgi:precorrin-6A/cobalt-precorrin-6A reductase
MPRLLILGGTGEAAALAGALAEALPGLDVVTSLAGRTTPPRLPGRVRVGGFGGTAGLEEVLRRDGIDAVVDATHPFAARISAHAEAACAAMGLPRLVLHRPEWRPADGDRWTVAADMADAASRLPALGKRPFLAIGRQELAAFAGVAGVEFVVRLLAPAPPPLPLCRVVVGRGPFAIEDEVRLLGEHGIDVVVAKASGGAAGYGKIAAARTLGLPVLLVRRPPPPVGPAVDNVAAAVAWVAATCAAGGCGPGRTGGNR